MFEVFLLVRLDSSYRFHFPLTLQGNGLNVIKVMPESAIKFGAYEASKRAMSKIEGHRDPQKISGPARFVAGGIGGIVSQLFAYPLDTLYEATWILHVFLRLTVLLGNSECSARLAKAASMVTS